MGDEEFLTVPEVAARFRVSERWVYTNLSTLPHRRLGRSVRFARSQIDDFMTGATSPAPTPSAPAVEDDHRPVGRGRRA